MAKRSPARKRRESKREPDMGRKDNLMAQSEGSRPGIKLSKAFEGFAFIPASEQTFKIFIILVLFTDKTN